MNMENVLLRFDVFFKYDVDLMLGNVSFVEWWLLKDWKDVDYDINGWFILL